MELSLAQLLGLYFILVGVIVLYRRQSIMPAIRQLAANRPLLMVIAFVEILAGIGIVLTYPTVTASADGIIAVIGWMLVFEGVLYASMPYRRVQKFIGAFNTPQWYGVGGVLAVIVGVYLAGTGFGYFM